MPMRSRPSSRRARAALLVAGCALLAGAAAVGMAVDRAATPAVPANVVGGPANGAVVLRWDGPADAVAYDVRARPAGQQEWAIRGRARGRVHVLTGLRNGTAYEIGVRARGRSGRVSPPSRTITVRPRLHWMVTGENVRKMSLVDPAGTERALNSADTYALGNPDGAHDQVPAGHRSVATLVYRSYRRFRDDVQAGRIAPSVRAVVYDAEGWEDTPDDEQRDPPAAFRRFAELARSRGYQVVTAPGRDLVSAAGACARRQGETLDHAFLRCEIAGHAARQADVVVVQAQAHQRDPEAYRRFVARASDQARAANPGVIVVSALTTSGRDGPVTDSMLVAAAQSVRGMVAGHWVTILGHDARQVQVATAFFASAGAPG